jgi:hypothetical protein
MYHNAVRHYHEHLLHIDLLRRHARLLNCCTPVNVFEKSDNSFKQDKCHKTFLNL